VQTQTEDGTNESRDDNVKKEEKKNAVDDGDGIEMEMSSEVQTMTR
jgi:hypothetical protein